MKKEILKRGYVTHMLTNESGEIYGTIKSHYIDWNANQIEKEHAFYWSEVYIEPNYIAIIIRKGQLLENPTPDELQAKFEQSKINYEA